MTICRRLRDVMSRNKKCSHKVFVVISYRNKSLKRNPTYPVDLIVTLKLSIEKQQIS